MNEKNTRLKGIIMSLVLIVTGLLLALFPNGSAKLVCFCIAAMLLVLGVATLVIYFKKTMFQSGSNDLVQGVLYLILSLLLFSKPFELLAYLILIFGIVLVVDAVLKIEKYAAFRRVGIKPNFSVLIFAALTFVLGLMMIFNPFGSEIAITIFAGISLIVDGAIDLASLWLIRDNRKRDDKVIDLDDDDINLKH